MQWPSKVGRRGFLPRINRFFFAFLRSLKPNDLLLIKLMQLFGVGKVSPLNVRQFDSQLFMIGAKLACADLFTADVHKGGSQSEMLSYRNNKAFY